MPHIQGIELDGPHEQVNVAFNDARNDSIAPIVDNPCPWSPQRPNIFLTTDGNNAVSLYSQ